MMAKNKYLQTKGISLLIVFIVFLFSCDQKDKIRSKDGMKHTIVFDQHAEEPSN